MKKLFIISLAVLLLSLTTSYAQQKKVVTLQSLSEDVEMLKKLCSQQLYEITRLSKENDDLRKRVSGNNTSYSSQDNITSLAKEVKELRDEFNKVMGTSYSWNQPKIPDLQKRIESLEERMKSVTGSSSSYYNQPNISDLSKRVDRLDESLKKLSGSSSSYNQPNLNDLSRQQSNLEKKLTTIENRLNNMERYERRISELERKVK